MKALWTALIAISGLSGFFVSSTYASGAPAGGVPIPQEMLAAAFVKGGLPDVLTVHRLPVPQLKEGEVLIAVHVAGIGAWDVMYRQRSGDAAASPIVLGSDGAGVIAAVGPGVRGLQVGDRVYAYLGRTGFYAEYVATPAEHVALIPSGMSFEEAGILAASGLAAIQGIDDVLQLKRGETLIVHGAAGGVGTLAIQFAKLRGVRVLATASSDEGLKLVRRLGADVVINGRTDDIEAAAKRFAPKGIDAILTLAGGEALERCIDALRRDYRGRVAYLAGMEPLPKPRYGVRMTLYSNIAGPRELEQLNRAVEAAKVTVPIAAEYPLANAAEAHRRFEARNVLGKIALRIR